MSLIKPPIAKRKHKLHLVKFNSNVILVVHKKIVREGGVISYCGFLLSSPPDFS
jgi:hypothetical protein